MKKFTIISNIVLIVAVAALYVLFFTSKGSSKAVENGSQTNITAQKGDIVYIQLDTLVNQYDMYNDLRSELQGKVSAIENDLTKKGRALENDIKSFQEKMNKGLLTRSQAETINNDLMARQQELGNLSQQKQMEMAEEERVMVNRVINAITIYINEYNRTHEYALILTTSTATNTVINGNEGLDITEDILNGINAEYIKTRNRK